MGDLVEVPHGKRSMQTLKVNIREATDVHPQTVGTDVLAETECVDAFGLAIPA